MDLYRDDINIVIQWETAPLTTGKTTKSEKGLSIAYLKDVSLFKTEGKMLFGWALNDTITQNAGLIKFSVRFYKLNADKEIDFSLSTLTAQATINPGLNYTWEAGAFTDKVYDDYQLIQNRIKDSVQPSDAGVADEPEFLEGFHLDTAFELTVQEKNEKGEIVETTYKAIDLESKVDEETSVLQRDFIVQASGEGSISYRWSRKDLNDNVEVDLEISDAVGIKYIPTKDTKYSGEKLYYTQNSPVDGIISYSIFQVPHIDADIVLDDGVVLYEKVSHCKVTYDESVPYDKKNNVTGVYTVHATNKVGLARATTDEKVLVPGPDKATFKIEMPEGQNAQVYLEDAVGENEGDGVTTLKILGTTARVTNEETGMSGDTIVYTWGKNEPVETINTASSVANEYTIPTVAAAGRAQYDETVTVEVYATRNGERSETLTQDYRITDAAHAPLVKIGEFDSKDNDIKDIRLNSSEQSIILQAQIENFDEIRHTQEGDSITYKWYKVVKDGDGTTSEFVANNDALLVDPDGQCITVLEDGRCQMTFKPSHIQLENGEAAGSGLFYCVVTNVVNGSSATNDIDAMTLSDCIAITIAD